MSFLLESLLSQDTNNDAEQIVKPIKNFKFINKINIFKQAK